VRNGGRCLTSRSWWPALFVLAAMPLAFLPRAAHAGGRVIPAFARKYRTGCVTCHTAPPKLNVLGEAFRLNGYRLPENPALVRREPPIPLGEEPWKELWPRAIWPGELASAIPLALRVQSDVQARRRAPGEEPLRLVMPGDVYLLAATTFGDGISAFVEAEWERDEGVSLQQAKILFQDPLPFLPSRLLNVMAGRQNPYLLTLGDRILDQAGRRPFAWQEYRASEVTIGGRPIGGEWQTNEPLPGVSANGLWRGRLFYSAGVAQVDGNGDAEAGRPLVGFYTVRYKLGGLRLDGRYDRGDGPVGTGYGQLMDRSVTVELFGHRGREALEGVRHDRQRALGGAIRLLHGPLDLGVGAVRRDDHGAWDAATRVRASSVFAKAEVLVLPWFIASLKGERFRVRSSVSAVGDSLPGETTLVPGAVLLLRQNLRLIVESEWYARHAVTARRGERRPHGAALRLDFSF
jgi:hypothetical protein